MLLGQRKEAEHIQISRKSAILDDAREERTHEERAWVRKRFAEIALYILSQGAGDDKVSKAEVVKLLMPRFIDQGGGRLTPSKRATVRNNSLNTRSYGAGCWSAVVPRVTALSI